MKAIVDLLVLACLLVYLYKGTRRGFLLSLLGVLSIVCSYLGAYAFSRPAGEWFEEASGTNPLTARIVAGAVIFLFIALVFSALQKGVKVWLMRKRKEGEKALPLTASSRTLGGLISLGAAVVLLTVLWWVYDAFRATSVAEDFPDLRGSAFAGMAQGIVRGVAEVSLRGKLGKAQAGLAADLISSPAHAVGELRALLDEPAMQALFESETFRQDFLSGEKGRVSTNAQFVALLEDPSASKRLQSLGFVSADAPPEEVREKLGGQLAEAGGRLNGILEDPEVKALIEELNKEKVLENPDWKTLVFDRRIREIASRALEPKEQTEPEAEEAP